MITKTDCYSVTIDTNEALDEMQLHQITSSINFLRAFSS